MKIRPILDGEKNVISLFSKVPIYYQRENILFVPYLPLQGVFKVDDYPTEMKFGLLGSMLAHEIVHSIDAVANKFEQGGKYDAFYWTKKTESSFKEKMKCLIQAYKGEHMEINGNWLKFGTQRKIACRCISRLNRFILLD